VRILGPLYALLRLWLQYVHGTPKRARTLRGTRSHRQTVEPHKCSTDGSGKGDAYFTVEQFDVVWGVLFEIDSAEKPCLDKQEGLGKGYSEKQITVIELDGAHHPAFMYAGENTHINPMVRPYTWYKKFVVEGARQHCLPEDYIAAIEAMEAIEGPDRERDTRNRAILC
jgi:gamma-glutamylcyclotransferase